MKEEKKKSNFLGWFSLVLLVFAMLGLNYVKFFMNVDETNIEETSVDNELSQVVVNALTDIVNNFNENERIKEYQSQNVMMNASLNQYSIFVEYTDTTTNTFEFHYDNLVLSITVPNDEVQLQKFRQVYEILILAVQKRLENNIDLTPYINGFFDEKKEYDGLIVENIGNQSTYRMNITKKLGVTDTVLENTDMNTENTDTVGTDEVNETESNASE